MADNNKTSFELIIVEDGNNYNCQIQKNENKYLVIFIT